MSGKQQSDLLLAQIKKYSAKEGLFFVGDKILIKHQPMKSILPVKSTVDDINPTVLEISVDKQTIILNCEINYTTDELLNKGYITHNVKKILAELDVNSQSQILRAYHWRNWHRQSKFCGQCGSLLEDKIDTPRKKMPYLQNLSFPKILPSGHGAHSKRR